MPVTLTAGNLDGVNGGITLAVKPETVAGDDGPFTADASDSSNVGDLALILPKTLQ